MTEIAMHSSEPGNMEIQLLGAFRLAHEGAVCTTLDSPRIQSLLAYLLLHRGSRLSRQQVAYLFWPDSPDQQARTNLRQLLYRLRRDLPAAEEYLSFEGTWLHWRSEAPVTLDIAEFELALASADAARRAGETERALEALETAVVTYHGALLPDCYDEWILPERERLRQQYVAAVSRLASLLENRRAYEQAIGYARRLLALDELQEKGYRQLMRLHALAGNRAAAVRVYHNCVTVLDRELGVAPAPETREMYEQLLAASSVPGTEGETQQVPGSAATLVGRQEEWAALQGAWQVAQNRSHLVLVTGEAGMGKTRLAEQLLQWASRQGIATATARCYPGEGNLAYAPVAAWLRSEPLQPSLVKLDRVWLTEIERILPELSGEKDAPVAGNLAGESWQQSRFYEALANAFAAFDRPLVLMLDDLQWADRATLDWLSYFTSKRPLRRLLIVGTVRQEEVVEGHALNPLRWHLLATGQLTEIELGPLGRQETAELAALTAAQALEPEVANNVFRETEGNPFFVIEAVRMALANQGNSSDVAALPPRVRAVVEARLNQLAPRTRQVAELAAVFNSQFTYELLRDAGDYVEEDVVGALDELWYRRLVREVDDDAYDFSHAKIREVAYDHLSPPRRQMLHRRLAQTLEKRYAHDLDRVSGRIAEHLTRAGERGRALGFWIRAADLAASLYAYAEAESLYGQAIALASEGVIADADLGNLYARRGRMLEHAGRFQDAAQLYQQLRLLAEERQDKAMAGLALARLVSCYIEPNAIHDLQAAEPLIAEGLALARETGDARLEADLLWSQMIRETHYGNTVEAQQIGERCLPIVRTLGLDRQLGYVLHDLGMNLRLSGAAKQGQAYAHEAEAVFRRLQNLPMLADSLNQTALIHILHFDFAAAEALSSEALKICQRIGNEWNSAYAIWLQGMVWSARGEWSQALVVWQEASERGQQAGFLMALTAVRLHQANLLRQLGDLAGAESAHLEAHATSAELAPFMLAAVESELARDAIARSDFRAGQEWLAQARERPVLGDIATALFLSSLALAETEMAANSGDWAQTLDVVEQARAESRRRGFVGHETTLGLALGCCLVALERTDSAETVLRESLEQAQHAGHRPLQWQTASLLGALLRRTGQVEAADQLQQAAGAVVEELAESLAESDRALFLKTPAVQAALWWEPDREFWPFPLVT
jgi:DNA-binding SARP family transcriptional activator